MHPAEEGQRLLSLGRRRSNCFALRDASLDHLSNVGGTASPSAFAPSRLRLATRPDPTGSPPVVKTIGIVIVAAFAASAAGVPSGCDHRYAAADEIGCKHRSRSGWSPPRGIRSPRSPRPGAKPAASARASFRGARMRLLDQLSCSVRNKDPLIVMTGIQMDILNRKLALDRANGIGFTKKLHETSWCFEVGARCARGELASHRAPEAGSRLRLRARTRRPNARKRL